MVSDTALVKFIHEIVGGQKLVVYISSGNSIITKLMVEPLVVYLHSMAHFGNSYANFVMSFGGQCS